MYEQELSDLLEEFSDRFDENNRFVSRMSTVDMKLKPEAKTKKNLRLKERAHLSCRRYLMAMTG